MTAYLQPDYEKIFASGAAVGEILNMPDESYIRGWGYLNDSEPPPMEFFNYIMNGFDAKLYYLFNTGNIRRNGFKYSVGDVITTPNLSSGLVLVCIQEGTSDVNEPEWPTEATASVNDGTCKWEVRDKFNATALDGKDRAYFETLIDNNAKIKKIAFTDSAALWSDDDGMMKLSVERNGYSCLAAYKTDDSGLEEQVVIGVSMDADNIYITSLSAFSGYLIAIDYSK